ncbi:hypothetical protein [Algoriphagus alkaliphilus]|uniref:hypothetical protein n=1 Tax=Algoriphagus alkaliphilus TaxID=279824 RepID=UPI001587CECB|nr:hypothetical protein [Algoriphagus alkaliphilus]
MEVEGFRSSIAQLFKAGLLNCRVNLALALKVDLEKKDDASAMGWIVGIKIPPA